MKHKLPILAIAAIALIAAGLTFGNGLFQPVSGKDAPDQQEFRKESSTTDKRAANESSASSDNAKRLPDGNNLMRRAALALQSRRGLHARIRQKIDLFGHQLFGSGDYMQEGGEIDARLRLELKFRVGDQTSSLLQICDGDHLWIHRELGQKKTLTRISIRDVKKAIQAKAESAKTDSTSAPAQVPSFQGLSLGGLPELLTKLSGTFDFRSVELRTSGESEFYVVNGTWRADKLSALGFEINKLPPRLPQSVSVTLGSRDLFPYRIDYLRHDSPGDAAGQGRGPRRSIVSMEFLEVKANVRLSPQYFTFKPAGTPVFDVTESYLKQRGLIGEDSVKKSTAED